MKTTWRRFLEQLIASPSMLAHPSRTFSLNPISRCPFNSSKNHVSWGKMRSIWKSTILVLTLSVLAVNFIVLADDDDCPSKTNYRCSDGIKCIPKSYICNHENDCPDRDDEQNCGKLQK